MAKNPRRVSGRDRLAQRVKASGEPCWMCGLPIRADETGTPLSFELDDLVPVSKGGRPNDPANVAPAHRVCNRWRGNKSVATVSRKRAAALERFGQWRTPTEFVAMVRAVGGKAASPIRHPEKRRDR